MDIKLEKKPWYIRHAYLMVSAFVVLGLLIYMLILSMGPRKLRVKRDNIQIAEAADSSFMEYVDAEGIVQPILTIKVNASEAGSVKSLVAEEGSMQQYCRDPNH